MNTFLQRLETGPPILADGAMGTQLYESLGYRYLCFEELNATQPQLVQAVHRAYLSSGAELIETNTFGCNRYVLGMRGLEAKVERFAQAGARIAREAQEALGAHCFVAGSIGPINRLGLSDQEIRSAFTETIEGLLLGGVDLFIFETFGDVEELLIGLEVAKKCSSLPTVASMTYAEDGLTLSGQREPGEAARTLQAAGADVVGANCGFGPQPTLEVLQRMSFEGGPPLGAMPNAGLPGRVDGRLVYASSPNYFAEYTEKFVAAGARIVGGCCGTTPAHIRRMAEPLARSVSSSTAGYIPSIDINRFARDEVTTAETDDHSTVLGRAFQRGEFVVSVEMRPPRGANPRKVIRNAEMLREAGVTLVDVTDSALGRVRMNPFFTAHLIQAHTSLEVVAHLTTRDRNIMALQSDLLGAHALGIRHVLALTGDPPNPNSFAPTTGVYDLDSIGLIALIKKLNQGQDGVGTSIGAPTEFMVGCSLNPTASDLELELDRFARKVEAGADFAITQAVYDVELFERVLHKISAFNIPVILELLPLQNFKNAEFIHNELAGVTIPVSILERMRLAGSNGIEEGMKIALETYQALREQVNGVYIIPSFDRYEQAAQLTGLVRS